MIHVRVVPVKNIRNAVENSIINRGNLLPRILCDALCSTSEMELYIFKILAGSRGIMYFRGEGSAI